MFTKKLQMDQLKYTVCFLTRGNDILMLHRRKAPNKGLWNGVGGHIEKGETPRISCLREVHEETGFILPDVVFGGILTWGGYEIAEGGLYIYTAAAPHYKVVECDEGHLKWFPKQWVYSASTVVSNIHYFLPRVLKGEQAGHYHFEYENGEIISRQVSALPAGLDMGIL